MQHRDQQNDFIFSGARRIFHMKKKLIAVPFLLTVILFSAIGSAWSAGDASDARTVKQQLLSIPGAQKVVADAAGYEIQNIEIKPLAHRMTIIVIDSTLNSGVSKNRESEATTIVSSLVREMGKKAEFAQVVIIHVDYVESLENRNAVEAYEFYKTPAGVFVIHKT